MFAVLHYGILSRTFLDSEQMTKEREELKLRPAQLAFLLQDLSSKLSSTFGLFGSKVSFSLSHSYMINLHSQNYTYCHVISPRVKVRLEVKHSR